MREQALRAVAALRATGGVISPKSTLELVVWLGKGVGPGGGSMRAAGNAWEALLAHWLRLSVGVCSMWRLQQFLGCAQWICRPRFGHSPHLSCVWAHVLWGTPPPPAVDPPQVAALYCVWGVCVGAAGLVGGIPTAGRA